MEIKSNINSRLESDLLPALIESTNDEELAVAYAEALTDIEMRGSQESRNEKITGAINTILDFLDTREGNEVTMPASKMKAIVKACGDSSAMYRLVDLFLFATYKVKSEGLLWQTSREVTAVTFHRAPQGSPSFSANSNALVPRTSSTQVVSTPSQKPSAAVPVDVTLPLNKGIENWGANCYIASSLQCLLRIPAFQQWLSEEKTLAPEVQEFRNEILPYLKIINPQNEDCRTLKRKEAEKLRDIFCKHGWLDNDSQRKKKDNDAAPFVDFLLKKCGFKPIEFCYVTEERRNQIIGSNKKFANENSVLEIATALLPQGIESGSFQDIFAKIEDVPSSTRAVHMSSQAAPQILPIVSNRGRDGEKQERNLIIEPTLRLKIPHLKKDAATPFAEFQLAGILVYRKNHYYTVVPYKHPGKEEIVWVEFNDDRVIEHAQIPKEAKSDSYMYMYYPCSPKKK